MYKTITIGSCVSIQGMYVCDATDGKVVIRVGDRQYTGKPVGR